MTDTETAPRRAVGRETSPEGIRLPGLRGAGTAARRAWRRVYVRRIVLGDGVSAAIAAAVGYLLRFGAGEGRPFPASLVIAISLPLVWVFAMALARSYEERFLWEGP